MGITLLLTQLNDPTADFIQKAFNRNQCSISRINLGNSNLPQLSIEPIRGDRGWIEDTDGVKVNVNEIKAIIVRRPAIPNLHKDEVKNRFLSREVLHGLRSFLESTSAIWMNHPDANSIASSKPRNLRLASRLGLNVPQTLVSSNPMEISNWLKSHGSCVIKAITYGLMEGEGTAEMAFTQRVPKEFNIKENILPGVPILIQEEIEKEADIRTTIVGNKAFSAILPQKGDEIDWRKYDNNSRWKPFQLPQIVEEACIKLCNELELEFGAIDLVKSLSGNYFFLELNPNGQWVWIEEETGLGISEAIVEHLSRG